MCSRKVYGLFTERMLHNPLKENHQVVCLVLDQFEELYAKSELFPIFEAAEKLMLSTAACQSNFVLGFAWRTDASVQQNHPAYYLWHKLADQRIEISLTRFNHAEASRALAIFEKELGEKLRPDLRKHLLESSQGYPWLLKKLCIHIYEQILTGASQSELLDKALDVKTLFDRDLQELSQAQSSCLRLIAENAPVDWYEVLEIFGADVVHVLQDKRLIVRSGDKVNLYWDIFREYILTEAVPSIPLSYLPTSPSIKSMLRVASHLDLEIPKTPSELAELTGLSEKTAQNVIRDLKMFGAAVGPHSNVRLAPSIDRSSPDDVLARLRETLKRHALTLRLSDFDEGTIITPAVMAFVLREINPAAQSRERTWKIYAQRMGDWLSATGFISPVDGGWMIDDQGKPIPVISRPSKIQPIFIGDTTPENTIVALDWLKEAGPQGLKAMEKKGFRNAALVLRHLGIIQRVNGNFEISQAAREVTSERAILNSARESPTIIECIAFLERHPSGSGKQLGKHISEFFNRGWSETSQARTGYSLRKWALWVLLKST